jgi:AraC-like DNA-binding protein
VTSLSTERLSPIERLVVTQIRRFRASGCEGSLMTFSTDPTQIMYHVIVASRGHVQLRFSPIAQELGADMRSLQRSFGRRYRRSMLNFQLDARLSYSKHLLSISPPQKVVVIAATLGYNEVRDFNYFFQKQVKQTPSEWVRNGHEQNAFPSVILDATDSSCLQTSNGCCSLEFSQEKIFIQLVRSAIFPTEKAYPNGK